MCLDSGGGGVVLPVSLTTHTINFERRAGLAKRKSGQAGKRVAPEEALNMYVLVPARIHPDGTATSTSQIDGCVPVQVLRFR